MFQTKLAGKIERHFIFTNVSPHTTPFMR